MMLGDKVEAKQALEMGMLYKMVSHDALEEETQKIAITLANMPTKAIGMTKELLNASMTNSLDEQLAMESTYQIEAAQTEDRSEEHTSELQSRFDLVCRLL